MKMKLDCRTSWPGYSDLVQNNVSPYFSRVGLFFEMVRTISTACQVFIFNIFLNFFNKFFLKFFISFIFYFLLYFNIQDYKKSSVSCNKFRAKLFDTSSWPAPYDS